MSESRANGLPVGWTDATFGDVADYINGRAFKSSEWETTGRPVIRIQNLTGSGSELNHFSGEVDQRHVIRDGELLISWSATLGAFIYRGEEAVLNQHIFRVLPRIDKKFLYYLASGFLGDLRAQVHGSGMQHITKGKFEDTALPLPPLNEQRRIVAKIEALFSELDAGVAALERAQALLERYRQSVLKAAFEGRLTAAWRAEHAGEVEPAEALLERIVVEREARERAEAAGGKRRRRRKALPELDTSELPELPEGWCWARLGELGDLGTGATPKRGTSEYYENGTVPWVTSGALSDGVIKEPSEFITQKALDETNCRLYRPGTLLVAMYGEGRTRGTVAELAITAATNQACAAIELPEGFNEMRRYVMRYLQKNYSDMRRLASGGVQPNLNLGLLAALAIPLAPQAEQAALAARIDEIESVIGDLQSTITAGLSRAARLRQAILKRAFEGRLVPQDPSDEPASVLLERIRAARGAEKPARRKRKPRRRSQRRLEGME